MLLILGHLGEGPNGLKLGSSTARLLILLERCPTEVRTELEIGTTADLGTSGERTEVRTMIVETSATEAEKKKGGFLRAGIGSEKEAGALRVYEPRGEGYEDSPKDPSVKKTLIFEFRHLHESCVQSFKGQQRGGEEKATLSKACGLEEQASCPGQRQRG